MSAMLTDLGLLALSFSAMAAIFFVLGLVADTIHAHTYRGDL